MAGIEAPVLLTGMSWISTPELVAAVSEAGGLGILATGPLSAEETRASIRAVRERTDRPFGVGITLMMPGARANLEVSLEEKVALVNYQLGRGSEIIEAVHEYGGIAMPTVTSEKHARSAEAAGADAVLATGHEAAAHGERVGSMVLIPAVARAVKIPVVAAGGIADGAGLAAALALGASAVGMGTRFAATQESSLHADMKRVITEKSQTETLYTDNFDGMWARIMKTPLSEKLTARPLSLPRAALEAMRTARRMGRPVWQVLAGLVARPQQVRMLAHFGAAIARVEEATLRGNVETGVQFIGQAQGLVHDTPSARDVVRNTVREAQAIFDRH